MREHGDAFGKEKHRNEHATFPSFALQVTRVRGEQLAVEYGIKFMETSAKASINVDDAFFTLARDIKCKMEKRMVGRDRFETLLRFPLLRDAFHAFFVLFAGSKQPTERWPSA